MKIINKHVAYMNGDKFGDLYRHLSEDALEANHNHELAKLAFSDEQEEFREMAAMSEMHRRQDHDRLANLEKENDWSNLVATKITQKYTYNVKIEGND